MKLRHLLPPALIASLLALTAVAGQNTRAPASGDILHESASCPMGTCCFMAAAVNPPAVPATSDTCVVSGDKLGEMGKPFNYVYKEAGKPDRIVPLCCKDCVKDFEKEPAKYLAKLDAVAASAKK